MKSFILQGVTFVVFVISTILWVSNIVDIIVIHWYICTLDFVLTDIFISCSASPGT